MELDRQQLESPMVQDIVQEGELPGRGRRIFHLIRAPIFGAEGQVDYIMTSATDIADERARMDDLRLEQATRRAQRGKVGMAVMFIDLDDFKKVNDTFGHDVGDLLLQEVASRLQNCVRSSDSVGRLGGDEFAIVVEDAHLPDYAVQIAERIVAAVATPFILDGQRVTSAASVGIAIYPNDGTDAATLLKNADAAMYQA
jgi:diguanylate cyclase (GGDEF)-like protein